MGMIMALSGGATLPDLSSTTSQAIDLVKSCMSLFEVYPLNVVLSFMLCGYAFKFFARGRKAAAGGA